MDDFSWLDGLDSSGSTDLTGGSGFDSGWSDVLGSSSDNSSTVDPYAGLDSYGSGPSGGGDPSLNASTDSGISDITSPSFGTGTGVGPGSTGSSFPWTSALLQGGGAVLQGLGSMYKDKADWKAKTDFMKAQLAEQEKYYQLHGAQLEAAYGNYKQFATPAGTPGPTAGLLAGMGGPSGYFK